MAKWAFPQLSGISDCQGGKGRLERDGSACEEAMEESDGKGAGISV